MIWNVWTLLVLYLIRYTNWNTSTIISRFSFEKIEIYLLRIVCIVWIALTYRQQKFIINLPISLFLFFLFIFFYDCCDKYLVLQNWRRFFFYMHVNLISKRQKHAWICITPFEQCSQKCLVIAICSPQTLKRN